MALSISCSNNQDDSSDDTKTLASRLYLKIDTKDKENEYLLDIYYGHDFYNDKGVLCTGTQDRYYGIDIYFVANNDNPNISGFHNDKAVLINTCYLFGFESINYDCVYNEKIEYKNCYGYRLNKSILNQDGVIQICLFDCSSLDQTSISAHIERLSYSKREGIF